MRSPSDGDPVAADAGASASRHDQARVPGPDRAGVAWLAEAVRQQALVAALAAAATAELEGAAGTAQVQARGLAAYRMNAAAGAERALATCSPTVRAALGADGFAALARACWRAHPPGRGDLAVWGDAWPAFIAAAPSLAAWPWLADVARLDLAMHHNEAAPDATPDVATLARLGSDDPARLRLDLVPGCAVIDSPWPVAAIVQTHRLAGAALEAALPALRARIEAREAQRVLVVRAGWHAAPVVLDAPTGRWVQALLAGRTLAAALGDAGADFDLAAWLAQALREGWLHGVVPVDPAASV